MNYMNVQGISEVNMLDPIRLTLLCSILLMYYSYMVFINGKSQMV